MVCLKLQLSFDKKCEKINQIEIDKEWCYISVTVPEKPQFNVEGWVGVDRNITGHCVVFACTKTNTVKFLGKKAQYIHTKYSRIRKKLQRAGKFKKLKMIKHRESNITKDINHKISKEIVQYAKQNCCGIKLEKLEGIRHKTKQNKSFKYSLHSWTFYQQQIFVEYKAKLVGVPVVYIAPAYTSQTCHKCGQLGNRNGKNFKCPHCGYTSHADGNAAWNIAYSEKLLVEPKAERLLKSASVPIKGTVYNQRLIQEGDCIKGTTDSPQLALA
jgi:putative transposase